MSAVDYLAALAAILVAAALLARIPRALFTEVAEEKPGLKRELALGAVIAVAGAATVLAFDDIPLASRLTLALCVMTLIAVVHADLAWLVVPDVYSLTLAVLALAAPWRLTITDTLLGAAVCGGLLALLAALWRWRSGADGLGFGDVKLAAAIGGLVGAETGLIAITVSAALAIVLVIGVRAVRRSREAITLIPYGAALALAGGCALAGSLL